jgi:hypothetical protein
VRVDIENPMVVDRLWVWKERTTDDDYFSDVFDDEVEEVECCICKEKMDREDASDSEIWEDTWLCDSRGCHNVHYQGWSESMELQRYYIKQKKYSSGNEYSFMGI